MAADFFVGRRRLTKEAHALLTKKSAAMKQLQTESPAAALNQNSMGTTTNLVGNTNNMGYYTFY